MKRLEISFLYVVSKFFHFKKDKDVLPLVKSLPAAILKRFRSDFSGASPLEWTSFDGSSP